MRAIRRLPPLLRIVNIWGFLFIVMLTYNTRFRQPNRGSFPLDSWQRQALAIVLLAALPLCGLALGVVIPPTLKVYGIAFGISVLGAWVMLVGIFVMILSMRPEA